MSGTENQPISDNTIVTIDCRPIVDAKSFHEVFAETLGFPSFYGRSMHAWTECMDYLDKKDSGMTQVHVSPGAILVLNFIEYPAMRERLPDLCLELNECAAFVNWRRIYTGTSPILALSYHASEVAG